MTFDARETSLEAGQPIKLYEFAQGAIRWRYTNADRDIVHGLYTYLAIAILSDGRRQTGQTSADEFKITVQDTLPLVRLFRASSPSTEIDVLVRELHHGDTEARVYYSGYIRGVRRDRVGIAVLSCESDLASLERPGLSIGYCRGCPHTVYQPGCFVDPEPFEVPGVVSAVTGITVTSAAWDAQPDGYFAGGYVSWSIGSGEYERRGVEKHVGAVLTLIGGADGIEVGMTVGAFPGCPGTEDVCASRFGNLPNYGGFKNLPGKSPFDGTPVF